MQHKKGVDRRQMFFTSLEEMVPQDSFARIIDLVVDALPLNELGFQHVELNTEGNEPYHPAEMLKLLIYGQRHGIRSANKLSYASGVNTELMWLLNGLQPAARTICYFRTANTAGIKKAHRHFVKMLRDWNLISGELLALDSTKVRGQNSLKNNYNQKKINRHLQYLDEKIETYLDLLCGEKPVKGKKKNEVENKLEDSKQRRVQYEQLAEQVQQSEDGQISTTDPDARAVIKHRNIVEVGYNIQATVEGDHLFVVDVYAGGVTDRADLGPAADRSQRLLEVEKIDLLADAGYHNGADIAYCERKGIRTFIPPGQQHQQKQEGFRKKDFRYDKDRDVYICPDGQELTHELTYKKHNSKRKYRVKRYGTSMCEGCPIRSKCTTSAAGRKIERPNHQAHVDRNNSRVKRYYDFYRLRQQIVEPVFGVWKRQWHFDHVILKGREKVEAETSLAAITWNIMRLMKVKGKKWVEKTLKRVLFIKFLAEIRYSARQYLNQTIITISIRPLQHVSCAA